MLNMMVTIMGETFNNMNPVSESVIIYTRMRLMFDHLNLRDQSWTKLLGIKRDKYEYQNYIYLVEPTIQEIEEISVTDQVTDLKNEMTGMINQLDKKLNETS